MAKGKPKKLPSHMPIDELVEFFDSHDMGDYLDGLPKVHFEIDIKKRRHLVAIDERIVPELNEIARSKKLPSERLINTWLREKIKTTRHAQKPR
jgi:hypothetical protein